MKKIIRKAVLILVFVMVCCVSYSTLNVSEAEDFNDMGNRAISNVNKVWTLKFRTPVDVTSLSSNVHMQDLTDGRNVDISILPGDDVNTAKVNPPSEGYKLSHRYRLTIDKSIKSKKGENLPKSAVLEFYITNKDNNSYNVSANVIVSPFISTFKKITISATNLPSASQYKIDDNKLTNVGSDAVINTSENTAKISLYDKRGNLLGTSMLNISSTKSNINTNITLAD